MEALLEVVFATGNGNKETMFFTEQPLGLKFRSGVPLVTNWIQNGSHAAELGVKLGWTALSINGEPLAGKTIYQAYSAFVQATAPLRQYMFVRRTPVTVMPVANLSASLKSINEAEVVPFLEKHGFLAQCAKSWGDNSDRPLLHFEVDGHREHGNHTCYLISGKLSTREASSTRRWAVERRLAHLRALLHDPVKQELGSAYYHHFENAPFANRGGPPGTTAMIQTWLAALSKAIRAGTVSPALTAWTFHFLEAPSLYEHFRQSFHAEPPRSTQCLPDILDAEVDQNTDTVVESGAEVHAQKVLGDEASRNPQDSTEQNEPKAKKEFCRDVDILESGVDDALESENEKVVPCQAAATHGGSMQFMLI